MNLLKYDKSLHKSFLDYSINIFPCKSLIFTRRYQSSAAEMAGPFRKVELFFFRHGRR